MTRAKNLPTRPALLVLFLAAVLIGTAEGQAIVRIPNVPQHDGFGRRPWAATFGGSEFDAPADVVQSADGDHLVCGRTNSFGAGISDAWAMRMGPGGEVAWEGRRSH